MILSALVFWAGVILPGGGPGFSIPSLYAKKINICIKIVCNLILYAYNNYKINEKPGGHNMKDLIIATFFTVICMVLTFGPFALAVVFELQAFGVLVLVAGLFAGPALTIKMMDKAIDMAGV